MTEFSRRQFLSAALLAPAAFAQTSDERFLSTVPLGNTRGTPGAPLERLLGRGLSARLFTELSTLPASSSLASGLPPSPSSVVSGFSRTVIPNEKFFIRTAAPESLPAHTNASNWTID